MTFLAPWMLAAGAAAALAVVALHLLTTRRPPPAILPTARFVPESDVRAVSRATRPTDLVLLALRALAVLLIGAAFARPVPDAPGPRVRSVIALEWSRAVADPDAARAAARAALQAGGEGSALVIFDTAARAVASDQDRVLDTLSAPAVAAGRLSPMLVAAREAARTLGRGADSVRLVVISAAAGSAADAATLVLRADWPGRIDLQQMAGAADTTPAPRVALVSALVDDPLGPALERLPLRRGAHAVRVVRGVPTSADSAWRSRAGQGAVLIVWPVEDGAIADAVTAFGARGAVTVVAPLARGAVTDGRVIARWRDGTAAATEVAVGAGCQRHVGIGLPRAGDLTLRENFSRLLEVLVEPCGGARMPTPSDSSLEWLTAAGPLATGAALAENARGDRSWPVALLVIALVLLLAEQLLRRRPAREVAA
jgi:hypothetical protein